MQMFKTKEDAVADFARHAIVMTDKSNKEHAAVLMKKNGLYYYTKIEQGFHRTVWPTALKYAAMRGEKYFLHTHPNHGKKDGKGGLLDNNPFSGVPGSRKLKDVGDAYVVDVLGYDGIYLVSAMGNAYLYEGVGVPKPKCNTYANTKSELRVLKPVITGLSQSKYCYVSKDKKRDRAKDYVKTPWSAK